jgi:cyclic nucleotide-binding protein
MYAHAGANAATGSAFPPSPLPGRSGNGNRLPAITSTQRRLAGEVLFTEGDEANGVYEIVSGMLRLVKLLPDGLRDRGRLEQVATGSAD